MSDFKYKAFISYSHADNKSADWLHRSLESYRPPKHLVGKETPHGVVPARMAPVFRDRDELSTATDLGAVLNEALAQSACQLVICSPSAAKSHWVNEEILAFKRLGREDRIFCVIVDGEPNASQMPGREDEECFPQALRYKLGPDGELSNEQAEPIAADLRPGKDGKADGKLKLIAGMLAVGFDDLKQREYRRRQRRLAVIAAASVVGMVIASTLATVAIFARAEAERQRARAEIEAETAQQTTDFLVDLFRVSDPSEALGNTITAREILDQGARRIEFELNDQPAIRSNLLDTMGTVYMRLGLYHEAAGLLNRGLETRLSLYGRDHPEVAASRVSLGELLGFQSELDEAADLYNEALVVQRGLGSEGRAELAETLFGLANIRSLEGRFEDTEAHLLEAIEIQRSIDGGESLTLAKSLDSLGMNYLDQGNVEEVEPLLQESVAMRRSLIPSGVHPEIYHGLNNLAVFYYEMGRFEESVTLFSESVDTMRVYYGDSHTNVAAGLNNLGAVLQDSGELQKAESAYRESLEIRLEQLGEAHPSVAQSYNNLSFLYSDLGDGDRALEMSRRAVDVYRSAYPDGHVNLAYGLQNYAGWLVEAGDYAGAEPLLWEALDMNAALLDSDHPDIAITRTGLAIMLLKTGRGEDALIPAQLAVQPLKDAYGDDHWRSLWAEATLGAALTTVEEYVEAEELLKPSYEGLRENPGARRFHVDTIREYLSELYRQTDRPELASALDEV